MPLIRAHNLMPAINGFESINRYWDRRHNIVAAKILPGELYVTKENEIIVTILGSCISVCISDKTIGIGGMNHFMLPEKGSGSSTHGDDIIGAAARYGNFAMEHLINEIIKNGGKKERLEVKVFGGGKIIKNMSNVGLKNCHFVFEYLKNEGLDVISKDVGDIYPRKIMFYAKSGEAYVKKLRSLHNDTIRKREDHYRHLIEEDPVEGDVELFD